jgi:hypothetical protein
MHEMEGPRLVSRRRPADFSASQAPVNQITGARNPPEAPVSRFFPRTGVSPGAVPVSGDKRICTQL